MPKYFLIIPAAGVGSRLRSVLPKQYVLLNGYPMICHTVDALLNVKRLTAIYIIVSANDNHWQKAFSHSLLEKITIVQNGGATRAATVLNGLAALTEATDDDWILVHDAARPGIDPQRVNAMIDELGDDTVGGLLAMPVPDTVKQGKDSRVSKTVSRDDLWLAQTPQMFRYGLLKQALEKMGDGISTDEAQAIEALGLSPRLVAGNTGNFKVTFPEDVAIAEAILSKKIERD